MNETDQLSLHDQVVFYPNGRGLAKMFEIIRKKYGLPEDRARIFIDVRLTENGGYRDYFHKLLEDFSSLLFKGTPYLDKVYIEKVHNGT